MKSLTLICVSLAIGLCAFAQKEVMRIDQKGGVLQHFFVDDLKGFEFDNFGNHSLNLISTSNDTSVISSSEINEISFFTLKDCEAYSGLYIGIIGFNDQLHELSVEGPLYSNSKNSFTRFIDNLQPSNGSLLYHSVYTAIDQIEQQCAPFDLSNVSIVTFTDGLDQGSWINYLNKYQSSEELLEGINNRIASTKINNLPLNAYTVGFRGNDVSDVTTFNNNLSKLASSADKVSEITNISSLNETFSKIANSLSTNNKIVRVKHDIDFTLPAQSPGTIVRFTLDDVNEASISNTYIEGTIGYNGSVFTLDSTNYHGLTSTSGLSVQGTLSGINLTFKFQGIVTQAGDKIEVSKIKQWAYVKNSNLWQVNSEFDPSQNIKTNSKVEQYNSSALVLLILDSSSSLGAEFTTMKTAAKNFVSLLLDGAGSQPQGPYLRTNFAISTTKTDAVLKGTLQQERDYKVVEKGFEYSTSHKFPQGSTKRINHSKNGVGNFQSIISNLQDSTKYYFRTYAKTVVGEYFGDIKDFTTRTDYKYSTLVDVEGNVYNTVNIGNQTWMAENLKATKYADGTAIPQISDKTAWALLEDNDTDKAYSYYTDDNSVTIEKDLYGALYTYAAATNGENSNSSAQGVCPDGWHLPSEEDWDELELFIKNDGNNNVGNALKTTSGWNTNYGTDIYGFSALASGIRYHTSGTRFSKEGYFYGSGSSAQFWTNKQSDINNKAANTRSLSYNKYVLDNSSAFKSLGVSVRCVKNGSSTAPIVLTLEEIEFGATDAKLGGGVTGDGYSTILERGIEYGTTQNFTPGTGIKILAPTAGTGSFTIPITGLSVLTTYYFKAYATNSVGTTYGNELTFKTFPLPLTDIDGNTYKTVKIGDQIWMASDLKTTKYTNGTPIASVSNDAAWANLEDNLTDKAQYNGYYTFAAATNGNLNSIGDALSIQGVCPTGWHVPSVSDWENLLKSLPNGSKNESGLNSYHFNATKNGYRNDVNGTFRELGSSGNWWTRQAYSFILDYSNPGRFITRQKSSGIAVRCVKNDIPTVSTGVASKIGHNSVTIRGEINNSHTTISSRGIEYSTSKGFTNGSGTQVAISMNGNSIGGFLIDVTGLDTLTTYYYKVYAINENGIAYGEEKQFKTLPDYIKDVQGNIYQVTTIGKQTWMNGNLKVTRYNNGTPIPYINNWIDWKNQELNNGAYTFTYNNSSTPYGTVYNYAAVRKGLCPNGWHVPNVSDWETLENFLNPDNGRKLKANSDWTENLKGTDDYGFSALPHGYKGENGLDASVGSGAFFWTSKFTNEGQAYVRSIIHNLNFGGTRSQLNGMSVRCIRDF